MCYLFYAQKVTKSTKAFSRQKTIGTHVFPVTTQSKCCSGQGIRKEIDTAGSLMQGHRQKQTTPCTLMPCETVCPECIIKTFKESSVPQGRLVQESIRSYQPTGYNFNEWKSIEINLHMQFVPAIIYRLIKWTKNKSPPNTINWVWWV